MVAGLLGLPAGLVVFGLAGGQSPERQPARPVLLAVIPATLIAVAVLTVIPARIGARRSVAEVLRAD